MAKPRNIPKYPDLALILILSAILTASFVWGAQAKYTRQRNTDAAAKAPAFYFTSDFLTEDGISYTLNPGINSFTFQLRNYDDLKVSELDIDYTYTVTVDDETVFEGDGRLFCGDSAAKTVTLSGLTGGKTYEITATGTNGYEQTLYATVHVTADRNDYHVEAENHGEYVILTIWTENTSEKLYVTVPDGLIPDWTDQALHGKVAGSTFPVELEPYQSRSFRFFTETDNLDINWTDYISGN